MNKIGIVSGENTKKTTQPAKKAEKTTIFVEFNKENAISKLDEEIEKIISGRKYTTLAKIAAIFKLDIKSFRNKCHEDDDLSKTLNIYNGVYVEDIMTKAIDSGKINAQTETYLKDEMQAYTGSGFEQHITFVEYDMSKDCEIEADVDIDDRKKVKGLFE